MSVIHLVARRLDPLQRDRVVKWLEEVGGPRRAEALESITAEGVDHETAMIIDTSDGPIIVYVMQTDDLPHSRAVADSSHRTIDSEHRALMRSADVGAADARIVLDLHPATL